MVTIENSELDLEAKVLLSEICRSGTDVVIYVEGQQYKRLESLLEKDYIRAGRIPYSAVATEKGQEYYRNRLGGTGDSLKHVSAEEIII
jgi:hypothetical protein